MGRLFIEYLFTDDMKREWKGYTARDTSRDTSRISTHYNIMDKAKSDFRRLFPFTQLGRIKVSCENSQPTMPLDSYDAIMTGGNKTGKGNIYCYCQSDKTSTMLVTVKNGTDTTESDFFWR